jgi:hypothetical protein
MPPGGSRDGFQGPPHGPERRFHGPEGQGGPQFDHDPEMQAINQADMDLDRKTHELSAQYRQAKGSDQREELKKQLAGAVQMHFEVRQKRRELELQRLEQQLERLRDSVKKRTEERGAIVERRLSELLGKQEDLGF